MPRLQDVYKQAKERAQEVLSTARELTVESIGRDGEPTTIPREKLKVSHHVGQG